MPDNRLGYGDRRRGFVRVQNQEVEASQQSNAPVALTPTPWVRQQTVVTISMILLYMLVSMSLTLLDKRLVTGLGFPQGLGFNAPLALITLTYFLMHPVSLATRACLRRQGVVEGDGSERSFLVQRLTWHQWLWKVFPVAAASGLEVGTSTMGLQVMGVGLHTMVRSTVPIFVLLFSVGIGLQEFRCGLLGVMFLVSGGVSLIVSGQQSAKDEEFPIDGFLLTLLSGMLAGLKWTLSQVLLQGRGLFGRGALTAGEHIHPFTLLHYMSISSAATLVPFVLALEWGALRDMYETFGTERMVKIALWIVLVSLLALVLVLTEFTFIKKLSALSLCIIGVVKELMLVLFSVVFLGEHLTMRTSLGFCVAMVGVILYKAVPKGAPEVRLRYEPAPEERGTMPMPPGVDKCSLDIHAENGGAESGVSSSGSGSGRSTGSGRQHGSSGYGRGRGRRDGVRYTQTPDHLYSNA